METAFKWINEKLAPPLYKFTEHRWIKSIMGGLEVHPISWTGLPPRNCDVTTMAAGWQCTE